VTVTRPRRALKIAAACLAGGLILWVVASAGLYAAMRQPPERFGAFMAYVPPVAMMVLPFKPLWMSARAGHLQVGDRAPDFSLKMLKEDRTVTLSSEHAARPVVLVFGSYT
jgi:hypothetical protein